MQSRIRFPRLRLRPGTWKGRSISWYLNWALLTIAFVLQVLILHKHRGLGPQVVGWVWLDTFVPFTSRWMTTPTPRGPNGDPGDGFRIACVVIQESLDEKDFYRRTKIQSAFLSRPDGCDGGVFIASDDCGVCNGKGIDCHPPNYEAGRALCGGDVEGYEDARPTPPCECLGLTESDLGGWKRRRFHTHEAIRDITREIDGFFDYLAVLRSDSLFYPGNARAMLRSLPSQSPKGGGGGSGRDYSGHLLEFNNTGRFYNHALAPYIISRRFAKAFKAASEGKSTNHPDAPPCDPGLSGDIDKDFHTEDDFAGYCVSNLTSPARDSDGREFFLPSTAKKAHHDNDGSRCCAEYPVGFATYKRLPELKALLLPENMTPTLDWILNRTK